MLFRLSALLVVSLAASAADAGPASRSEPDRSTLKHRCSELPPDAAEVQACFRNNMASLSPACRAEIKRHEKSRGNG